MEDQYIIQLKIYYPKFLLKTTIINKENLSHFKF